MKPIERQIFGGTNFLVVLWTLISLFRAATYFHTQPIDFIIKEDLLIFLIPMIFLLVINLLMGISSFFPQKKNRMWVLSILIITFTLVALNTFQTKIEDIHNASAYIEDPFNF